jgi:NIMA (never in mitosis gene a)-related kinase
LGCVLYELCTLQHAFDSNCMNGLIMKILRAKQSPIPYFYSQELRNLVDQLLQKAPAKRLSVNQILKLGFIRARIKDFLSETVETIEFSHTVLHGVKGGVTPKDAEAPQPRPLADLPVIPESKPLPPPPPKPAPAKSPPSRISPQEVAAPAPKPAAARRRSPPPRQRSP